MMKREDKLRIIKETIVILTSKGHVYYPLNMTSDEQLLESYSGKDEEELKRDIESNSIDSDFFN